MPSPIESISSLVTHMIENRFLPISLWAGWLFIIFAKHKIQG
ncbi:hypothetical protein PG5_20750 [Pseudomonas sp. G5(2012)]|nr:hypothetical protein PG5_20750 [Pseudomonas sp. G5(2012)]